MGRMKYPVGIKLGWILFKAGLIFMRYPTVILRPECLSMLQLIMVVFAVGLNICCHFLRTWSKLPTDFGSTKHRRFLKHSCVYFDKKTLGPHWIASGIAQCLAILIGPGYEDHAIQHKKPVLWNHSSILLSALFFTGLEQQVLWVELGATILLTR